MQHFATDTPYMKLADPPRVADGYVVPGEQTQQTNRQALRGLGLAVKDLFHVAGLPTAAGNPTWLATHPIPQATSSVVNTLLDQGARLIGKTITDELAYSLNGQNIHYGTPVNGANALRLPGGSSSGSAVAVATGSADIGLGTDTGGSIRVPASYNGLYGFRPSHGVISVDNMVALAPTFDTVGWMTRDLLTLSQVADVLLPAAANDSEVTRSSPLKLIYSSSLNQNCQHGVQLQAILATLAASADFTLHDAQDSLNPSLLASASHAFSVLQGAQIWASHGQWIETHSPKFAADIAVRFAWCASLDDKQIVEAQTMQTQFVEMLAALMTANSFIIIPTTPGPAPLIDSSSEWLTNYRQQLLNLTCIAGLGGLPQIHLPLATNPSNPCGFSIIGNKYCDRDLFELAFLIADTLLTDLQS
ncbi:MAG: amidase [Paraglaciecola sp.]|nr:amidase [Paraglaciecola sp.]NCT47774.1 amidase [Paraglaciecola sp.]